MLRDVLSFKYLSLARLPNLSVACKCSTKALMASNEDFDAIDPFPDLHALFLHYNALYFDNSLGACSVEWSSGRMTL